MFSVSDSAVLMSLWSYCVATSLRPGYFLSSCSKPCWRWIEVAAEGTNGSNATCP